jgi:hypothetical protein
MNISESYKKRLKILSGIIFEDDSEVIKHTPGLDEFLKTVVEAYRIDSEFVEKIKQFVLNSGCKKISVENIKMGDGLALADRLILSPKIFKYDLGRFLFILFHETAHQYQFKKYGEEKMFSVYVGDLDIYKAASFMKEVEIVADEFATRKIREFIKLGFLDAKDANFKGFYKNVPLGSLATTIFSVKDMLKKSNIKDPSKISELFYNWIKSDL